MENGKGMRGKQAKVFYDADADLGHLAGKRVAVLGFGSQGAAQAANLAASGVDVVVGLRPGSPSRGAAEAAGLAVADVAGAVRGADLVAMLVPDTAQARLWRDHVAANLKKGGTLLFSHGFNVRFGQIEAPAGTDVVMAAPKGPGNLVREVFRAGGGVPCLVAVNRDATGNAWPLVLAYAKGIGGTRAGALATTFAEETETDLFGEQAVLCGGVTELVKAGFDTLVEAGYQPEVAYLECLHELKLIVDLMHRGGLSGMRRAVSDTAKYGDVTRGSRVVGRAAREEMRRLLAEVQSGRFAEEWLAEDRAGRPQYTRRLAEEALHPVEAVGRSLRARMGWLGNAGEDRAKGRPAEDPAGRRWPLQAAFGDWQEERCT